MDKERLRRLFGEFGDANEGLEKMFGSAYLDCRDDSNEGIPEDFRQFSESSGIQVCKISGLIERVMETAPEITCAENQAIFLKYLKGSIKGNPDSTFEDIWAATKHSGRCSNNRCVRINNIIILEKRLPSEQIKADYGEEIKSWEIK